MTDGINSQKGLVFECSSAAVTKDVSVNSWKKKKKGGKLYQYEQILFTVLMATTLLAMQTRTGWIIPIASKHFTG